MVSLLETATTHTQAAIHAQLLAQGLNFPTGVVFDDAGNIYITESGLLAAGTRGATGSDRKRGRIVRVDARGQTTCLSENLGHPLTGLAYHDGALYISEGGNPGRILSLDLLTNKLRVVVGGLPGGGDYHTNPPCISNDGWLYFGQGAATNSGIVEGRAEGLPWTKDDARSHDTPGYDVVLSGVASEGTGPFQPPGRAATAGTRLPGRTPCTAAVLRCRLDGSELEVVAWGLRNAYGLAFLDGDLLALDIGMNDRGTRPIGGAPDCLFRVIAGRWYGWPDYVAGVPVTRAALSSRRTNQGAQPSPEFLLSNHAALGAPELPLFTFEPHSTPTSCVGASGSRDLWITLFGDKCPVTGPEAPGTGRCVAHLDLEQRRLRTLLLPELARPISLAIHPRTGDIHVLDFGRYEVHSPTHIDADPHAGKLWHLGCATELAARLAE